MCLELTLYLLFPLLIIFSSSDNLKYSFFPDWITSFRFYFRICRGTSSISGSFPFSAQQRAPVSWSLWALSCLIVPPLWAVCVCILACLIFVLLCSFTITYLGLEFSLKNFCWLRGWRDSSAVTNIYYPCGGPKFCSQYPHLVAHNSL